MTDSPQPEPQVGNVEEVELPPQTAPENIPLNLRGFPTEDSARTFGNLVAASVRVISRYIDLRTLDGITVAFDYSQALLELDRGYPSTFKLTPSSNIAYGVAMTPAVIRDGQIKSHMLFNANMIAPLEDDQHELFAQTIHLIAHECAHVEVTERFNAAFPGIILQHTAANVHEHYRWQIIKACWDEYAVTKISSSFGSPLTAEYEETLIHALAETRFRANALIREYRSHLKVEQIVPEVYGVYGDLMKFACYHLGNMAGIGLTLDDLPKTRAALEGHWFANYFEQIGKACAEIAEQYGAWTNRDLFEALGDIADEVVAEGGVKIINHQADGGFYVDIPLTPETMPELVDDSDG